MRPAFLYLTDVVEPFALVNDVVKVGDDVRALPW